MDINPWLTPAVGSAAAAAIAWLVRLESLAKRAHERAEEAWREAEKLESELDALRPVATHLEVLAARMTALIERVGEGNAATRERFNQLDQKLEHALNNARQAISQIAHLQRRHGE